MNFLDRTGTKSVMPVDTQYEHVHASFKSDEDVYFSADIETDGSIPGPYSILSFALVYAGRFDGNAFIKPKEYTDIFYKELKPISNKFEQEALKVNGLDRDFLLKSGDDPRLAMTSAFSWVKTLAGRGTPVLVAYPLSFDWAWLYWYFTMFSEFGSPFGYSQCFDIKTAVAVKSMQPISKSGRSKLPAELNTHRPHTHHAVDDAIEQAEIFANVYCWKREI